MKPGREAALRWRYQAEHDLTIARGHQERGDYSDACFMAEQAAQKALKAFLIGQGQRPQRPPGKRAAGRRGRFHTGP